MDQEIKNCQNCNKNFAIEPDDFAFYEKIKVPAPAWCPECRLIKRLSWRNERSLFKRKCDLCRQEKILMFPEESTYPVYCYSCWWSDKWGGENYAREYDFSRPFFEQFNELSCKVPKMGIVQQHANINSEYTNRAADDKNCYLIFASANNENCSYGTSYWGSKDSIDCYNIHNSELCFECIDCYNCNQLSYSQECKNCTSSVFLLNCRNCTDCFGCVNLRNKSYCLFNEQLTREEYKSRLAEFKINSSTNLEKIKERFIELKKKFIMPALVENHSVNVSGNWLNDCKNTQTAFNCSKTEDGKYLFGIMEAKDVMDYTYWGKGSELMYECSSIGFQCSQVFFSNECWDQLIRAQYCVNCHGSSDLFGCVGLRKKQYCILNKQYTKEEYEKLVPKIKKHMDEMPYKDALGREWCYGSTFPLDENAFAYNQTIAHEFFPITKEDALKQGYRWFEPEVKRHAITLKKENIPDSIKDVDEQILKEVIVCKHEGKCNHQCTEAFKITKNDLNFYKRIGIPIPQLCPNCRHFTRLAQRNSIKLFDRKCTKCGEQIKTSYSPDRPEIVYCESCYNNEVV